MKRFFGILMMVIAMMTVTTNVCAQAPNQKQRLSREQLARELSTSLEIWGLMKRPTLSLSRPILIIRKRYGLSSSPSSQEGEMKTDAQTEQEIKQRFEMSEKILNIRQKYYKKYSQFLSQQQIQRVYELERQMMRRFAQRGSRRERVEDGKTRQKCRDLHSRSKKQNRFSVIIY